jgi:hypothetical protein
MNRLPLGSAAIGFSEGSGQGKAQKVVVQLATVTSGQVAPQRMQPRLRLRVGT